VAAAQADAISDPLPAADTAVANVTREVVEQLAPKVESDRLVASGYVVAEPPSLPRFRHVRRVTSDGWAADLFERPTR
jgi:hypothetical protein